MKIRKRMLLSAVLGAMITITTQADVVYDNLTTPLGEFIGGFPYEEVADDFSLGEGGRIFQSITVAYAGFNFDGDETLSVTLYAMDGPPTPGSFGFNTGAKNHGQFVKGVAALPNNLQEDGLITGAQKGAISNCVSKAALP